MARKAGESDQFVSDKVPRQLLVLLNLSEEYDSFKTIADAVANQISALRLYDAHAVLNATPGTALDDCPCSK